MPRAANKELKIASIGQIKQFPGLASGECHGLLDENMLPHTQGSGCLLIMQMRAAAYDNRLQSIDREQFVSGGASMRDAKIGGHFARLIRIVLLDGHKLGARDAITAQEYGRK